MQKRQFTAEYKTRIVLEVLREEKQLNELAKEHDISPNQLRNWKKEFIENAAKAFSGSKLEKDQKRQQKEQMIEKQELMAKVGQLTIENEWLKKKSVEMFGPDYEKRFNKPSF